MSRSGRFNTAGFYSRRIRGFAFLTLALASVPVFCARAAVADLLPDDAPTAVPADLSPQASKKAEAMAQFVTSLFEEESEGPDKAIDSKRKVLALDPTFTKLALELSAEYLRRGDTVQAISVLKDAAKAAPKNAAPSLGLSLIYLRYLHKPDLALKYAQTAQQIDPEIYPPYEALWEIYQVTGQPGKASLVLDRAAKAKTTEAEYWLALAQLRGRTVLREETNLSPAELDKVAPLLDKAAEYGAKKPEVLNKIGDFYVLSRQVERAIPFYERLYVFRPSYPKLREKLAASYLQTNQIPAGTKMLEEIVKENPLNLKAYDQLTELYLAENNIPKALAAAQQALIMESGNIQRHLQVSKMMMKLKEFKRGEEVLAEARKKFPRVAIFSFFHGLALSELKRHDEAMKAFEEALVEAHNSQPDLLDADFYFSYGAASEQAGRYVKAAELFKKSVELDPAGAARAYNYLGYMWVERNENLDEAEQLIRRALEMEPGTGAYMDSLGWLFYKQGKYEEALTELKRAADAMPQPDAVVYEHIGDTYDKLGKVAEAVLYWQKCQQIDPANKSVVAKLDKSAEKVAKQPQKQSGSRP